MAATKHYARRIHKNDDESTFTEPAAEDMEIITIDDNSGWKPIDNDYEYRRTSDGGLETRRRGGAMPGVAKHFANGRIGFSTGAGKVECKSNDDSSVYVTLNDVHDSKVTVSPSEVTINEMRKMGVYHGDNTPIETLNIPVKYTHKLPIANAKKPKYRSKCRGAVIKHAPTPAETEADLEKRVAGINRDVAIKTAELSEQRGFACVACDCTKATVDMEALWKKRQLSYAPPVYALPPLVDPIIATRPAQPTVTRPAQPTVTVKREATGSTATRPAQPTVTVKREATEHPESPAAKTRHC